MDHGGERETARRGPSLGVNQEVSLHVPGPSLHRGATLCSQEDRGGPAPGMPHPGRPRRSTYPLPQPERTASSAVTSAGGRCASCHSSRSSSSSEAAWPSTERNSCSSSPGEGGAVDKDRGGGEPPPWGPPDSPREPSHLRSAQAGGTCEPNPAVRAQPPGRVTGAGRPGDPAGAGDRRAKP